MKIGIPKEIKIHEYRVGMVPASVKEAVLHGHTVYVETLAGTGIGCSDEDYIAVGAQIVNSAQAVFELADMIVKVKEPQPSERMLLRKGQILFTYLHLAPDKEQTQDLINSGAICIAYETVTDDNGQLPLLAPMSEVAGRMSLQAGAFALEKSRGGRGILLAGVPGVAPANVVILGGGVVGMNAAQMAVGCRANVVIIDRNIEVLRQLDRLFSGAVTCLYSTNDTIEKHVLAADLVIGCVLVAGAQAPKLVTKDMIRRMKAGSAIVDVAIDQGGCIETSYPTTHDNPTYIVDDVVHYCVANMPGAVARTSTFALNNATLPYILQLADLGYKTALTTNKHLLNGLNIYQGQVTNYSVAQALGYPYISSVFA
ncbi:alanine dehydrogenase [Photobacterium sp. NCIMB 13483]|uniref:Alanine dehydrogenase n=1 Tax=Photobacterium piscicola TaxID=1378299 RepID=A0ABU6LHH4_9GAMM|nr:MULTISPECIES: alanine dehydrogenase [Photobacterium]MEC6823090.1 alanine dehydrogenase [Photobacterium piscicola]MEC6899016.1 alanine dehydrogenase [Photobacterium piscicola]PST85969.1 alanine dehydrogenase [Photobacterium sp. NCIMB 13483]